MKYFFTAFFLLFSSFSFASDNTLRVIGIEVNENTSRDELRSKVNAAGAVVIREDDRFWSDKYDIKNSVKNGDILELTYSIRTKKLADAKIYFEGGMSSHFTHAVYESLLEKMGKPQKNEYYRDKQTNLYHGFDINWSNEDQSAYLVGTAARGIVVNFAFVANQRIVNSEMEENSRLKKQRAARQVNSIF